MKTKIGIIKGDKVIWTIYALLTMISIVAVYSSIGRTAIADLGSTPTFQLLKHLVFVIVSFVAVIIISHLNYRIFAKLSLYGYFISIVLLLLVAGGERWLHLGSMQLQPSEIAKVCLIIFVARTLNRHRDDIESPDTFWRTLLVIVAVVLPIIPENFSTGALVFLSCYMMMFFAGVNKKLWWRLMLGGGLVVILGLFWMANQYQSEGAEEMVGRTSTWGHRVDSWLNPDMDQITQENTAKMAVARGGLFGKGIGSTIHGRLMTQAHNDFIFSIIIEEAGSIIAIIIFLLYSTFFYRCLKIARSCKGPFGTLCVSGMGTVIYIQALVNMSVAVGLLPVTGQTLPFISYGGTAFLFLSCGVGVIQAVARDNNITKKGEQPIIENNTTE